MVSNHSTGLTLDISGDPTLLPLLRAVFGDRVDVQVWRYGVRENAGQSPVGPCRDGSIHEPTFDGGSPVGHWICLKCSKELCSESGGCITYQEEGDPWRL